MPKGRAVRSPSPPPEAYTPPDLGSTSPETPHPEVTKKTSRRWEQREILLPGVDDGPRAIAYGEQRLAGKLQFAHYVALADELWLVIELCAGECDALIEVTTPTGALTNHVVGFDWNYWWYPGTTAGEVNPNLASVLPSWNEAFPGTCYVVVRLASFSRGWGGEIPELVWHMRTRK